MEDCKVFILLPTDLNRFSNGCMHKNWLSTPFWIFAVLLVGLTAGSGATLNQLSAAEKAEGWKLLFDGSSTQGWRSFKKDSFPTNRWVVEDGWLHCLGKGGGEIISDAEFGDFELQWEWKQAPAGNSGVKYFITETRNSAIGHEYQLIDEEREPDAKQANGKRVTASLYDVLKPLSVATRRPGEINESRILVKANHVEHWLNGAKVLEYECGSEAIREAVANSKFKNVSGFGYKIKGHILLQDHHSEVWFRNVKIRQ
jgi:hypothetical protein